MARLPDACIRIVPLSAAGSGLSCRDHVLSCSTSLSCCKCRASVTQEAVIRRMMSAALSPAQYCLGMAVLCCCTGAIMLKPDMDRVTCHKHKSIILHSSLSSCTAHVTQLAALLLIFRNFHKVD